MTKRTRSQRGTAQEWEELGKRDPLWAVASHPGRRRSDPNTWVEKTFLETGEREVDLIKKLLGYSAFTSKTIVEVGCGAGRLTRAFAARGARVIGIDISTSMLAVARKHTVDCTAPVLFVKANGHDLGMLDAGSCDIAVSWHVFQHIPNADVVMSLLEEIHRVLRRGGSACIHIPQRSGRNIRWRLYKAFQHIGIALDPVGIASAIPMLGIRKEIVLRRCRSIGFHHIDAIEKDLGATYYVLRK